MDPQGRTITVERAPAGLVLQTLTERLEAALGTDPWAVGHRAAALAFAARLLDDEDLDAFESSSGARVDPEVIGVLRRFMANPRDTRGFRID